MRIFKAFKQSTQSRRSHLGSNDDLLDLSTHSESGARCPDADAPARLPKSRSYEDVRSAEVPSSHLTSLGTDGLRSRDLEYNPGEETCEHSHLMPVVKGGLNMAELAKAMQEDALGQEDLVDMISELLVNTLERNDRLKRKTDMEAFEGKKAPVSINQYVKRILKYGQNSPCTFVVGLIYLERMKRYNRSVCLTSNNFQRLFLVAVMVAAKFLDDFYYANKYWAEVGGISTRSLNQLEVEFLFRLGFNLHILREDYDWFVSQIRGQEIGSAQKTLLMARHMKSMEVQALTCVKCLGSVYCKCGTDGSSDMASGASTPKTSTPKTIPSGRACSNTSFESLDQ